MQGNKTSAFKNPSENICFKNLRNFQGGSGRAQYRKPHGGYQTPPGNFVGFCDTIALCVLNKSMCFALVFESAGFIPSRVRSILLEATNGFWVDGFMG
jgi:hypothetical protein